MADEETNRQTKVGLVRILEAVSRQLQSDNVDENVIDNVLHCLDWIHSTVIRYADFANLFGTSKRTIKRHMNDFGLSARDLYFTFTDQELDELITQLIF